MALDRTGVVLEPEVVEIGTAVGRGRAPVVQSFHAVHTISWVCEV